MGLVWTFELELVQHFPIEFMDFAWRLSEMLPASLIVTDELVLLRTLVTDNILTVLAFNGQHHDMVAFHALKILVKLYLTGSIRQNG
jgi:hypothetical protein